MQLPTLHRDLPSQGEEGSIVDQIIHPEKHHLGQEEGPGGAIPMESTGLFFGLYKMKPQGYKCRCLFENINENKPI